MKEERLDYVPILSRGSVLPSHLSTSNPPAGVSAGEVSLVGVDEPANEETGPA